MTILKIAGKPTSVAMAALEPHVDALYRRPGVRMIGIVELQHIERMQPAPEADKPASVTCRITALEVPTDEQEPMVREAQRALFLQRTAVGTLLEDGEIELARNTLRLTGGMLHALETARLRAGLAHWHSYAERVRANEKLTAGEVRHELDAITEGLAAVLNMADRGQQELPLDDTDGGDGGTE